MAAQVAGNSGTGNATDLGGDLLDDNHQRKTEDKSPCQAIAELGADLAVCADAARIVIGGAGDQPRSKPSEEAR